MGEDKGNMIDYRIVLADMEAKRAALDAAIASLRTALPALLGGGLAISVGDDTNYLADAPTIALE